MTLRAATVADAPAIEAFLAGHAPTSMFLRSNLARYGPCGGDAPNATRMWIAPGTGRPSAVFGLTTAGMVLVQAPGLDAEAARPFARVVAGTGISGVAGPPEQVAALHAALGLEAAPVRLHDAQPLYDLPLRALRIPQGASRLRAATPEDTALLARWRIAYYAETLGAKGLEVTATAGEEIAHRIADDLLRVLEDPGSGTVAMTAFNAALPDVVQVGNVYTPPALRGRGHARRAVALHLKAARARGAARALLFAASPAACRAYEAIGFTRIGAYTLLLFDGPQRAATCR